MDIEEAARQWGMLPRSVRKAAKEGRIRAQLINGVWEIADAEVKPLPKSSIQDFIWVVLKAKNDPDWRPDFSRVSGVAQADAVQVFKQLEFRKYIDGIDGRSSLVEMFSECRITEAGIDLVQSKRLPGSILSRKVRGAGTAFLVDMLLEGFVRTVGLQ